MVTSGLNPQTIDTCIDKYQYLVVLSLISLSSQTHLRLSFTSKYKYLGTLMTHDGSDEANMSRQRGFFYARSNGLSKNFNACSPSVKATLFRTFCSNMYCGHLWHDFRKSALRKLKLSVIITLLDC